MPCHVPILICKNLPHFLFNLLMALVLSQNNQIHMERMNFIQSLMLTTLVAIAAAATTTTATTIKCKEPASVIKGAYWFEQHNFSASAINTSLLTHIFYAFLKPNKTTYTLQITNSTAASLSTFTETLRNKNPQVKTLASIGGAAGDPGLFARIAAGGAARAAFIKSTIEVARRFGLDGLDFDWEFPRNAPEMEDLSRLLREWRHTIRAEAKISGRPPLLLTAAVYFNADFFLSATERSYPVAAINKNLDWVNVMSYDLHGSWSNFTGAPAALFDPKGNVNAMYGLRTWIVAGLCPKKIVMGLPLYGRSWTLRDPNLNGIGAPATGPGPGGAMTFFQIEEFNAGKGATVVHDVETVSVYSYSGTTWVGYDDPLTVTAKVGFAQALGLRGYFFWAAGYDRDWKIIRQASKAWILA